MSENKRKDCLSHNHADSKPDQSKYDYIKIKVWLGFDRIHYYILSRYILSRTLTFAKIPQDSVRCYRLVSFLLLPASSSRAAGIS